MTYSFFRMIERKWIISVLTIIMIMLTNGCTLLQPLPPPQSPCNCSYDVVRLGETLRDFANRHQRNIHKLAEWNNLVWPYNLTPSQQLLVSSPPCYVSRLKFHTTGYNEIKSGLAKLYGVKASDINAWNPEIGEGTYLPPGLELLVSPPDGYYLTKVPQGAGTQVIITHGCRIVETGDTLYNIAKNRCGCSVEVLMSRNQLSSNTIGLGQKLCW